MIFQSKRFSATWDTWMYWHEGTFYLYYLITEYSPGEGVGVATSTDGVHYTDHGKILSASDDMVCYLGTGSVWKSPGFHRDGLFLCNYSEWRKVGGELRQSILFACSKDLLHWEKYGDERIFLPDPVYYREFQSENARWDCIFPLEKQGGYYGYWTAAPRDFVGVGFGESADGIAWKALPPPEISLGDFAGEKEVEAGAVCRHDGKYYLMAGSYFHEKGVAVYVADSPSGPFAPMEKNFALFSNRTHVHAYFPRFMYWKDELLVNFHVLKREENGRGRFYTALAPLKKVVFEEGILRLAWWEENERLRGEKAEDILQSCILESEFPRDSRLALTLKNGERLEIGIRENGEVVYRSSLTESGGTEEVYQRDLKFPDTVKLRLLVSGTFTELYLNGYFIGAYTLRAPLETAECGGKKPECYRMDISE